MVPGPRALWMVSRLLLFFAVVVSWGFFRVCLPVVRKKSERKKSTMRVCVFKLRAEFWGAGLHSAPTCFSNSLLFVSLWQPWNAACACGARGAGAGCWGRPRALLFMSCHVTSHQAAGNPLQREGSADLLEECEAGAVPRHLP